MFAGSAASLFAMVHGFLRHIDSRGARISTGDVWSASVFGWTSHSCVGMVHWKYHGILHSKLGYVVRTKVQPSQNTNEPPVAELVSAYPTAGGMYYVTKHVVPPEHVAAWAWIIGWCNFLGQAAGVASLAYTISQMIMATVVMHTMEGDVSTFVP
jgi:hypothetical protein